MGSGDRPSASTLCLLRLSGRRYRELSWRDTAKVAQQFIAGLSLKKTPSRRDDRHSLIGASNVATTKPYSIVPGGTRAFKNPNPALKCWATFIAFLRNEAGDSSA